jgi:hypothetical protein
VTLSPSSVVLEPGEATGFTATVTGTANHAVTWSTTDRTGFVNLLGHGDYFAGSTPGIYTVTATSVADPSASDTATVTITAPAGVTRNSSSASAGALVQGVAFPAECPSGLNHSTPGAINGTVSCSVSGSTLSCIGSADFTTTFHETFAGATLTSVTATGDGTERAVTFFGNFCADAFGSYSLVFQVGTAVRAVVTGTLDGFGSGNVLSLRGSASSLPLVDVRRAGSVDTSLLLTRGAYTLTATADANNLETSAGSFSVSISFSAP